MKKFLSIIIPSFNMEAYIERCLNSLIIPSIDDIEILVINDGSTDNTSEIAHSFESKFPGSIKVIDKSNGHYGSCVNRGLKEASGKYVKILDADDYFDTDNFEIFINFLKACDADIILNNYCLVNSKFEVIEKRNFPFILQGEGPLIDGFDLLSNQIMAMHAVTYKKSLLINNGYRQSEGVAYTDQEWIFYPVFYAQTIAQFPQTIYCYLSDREGQSTDLNILKKALPSQFALLNKRLEFYDKSTAMIESVIRNYVYIRFYYSLVNLYNLIILSKFNYDIQQMLSKFDQKLKIVMPDLYLTLASKKISRFLPLNVISLWRKNNRNFNSPILSFIRLCNKVKK